MPEILAEVEESIDITATVAATPGSLTDDYNDMQNRPSINGVTLEGDKTTNDLHIDHVPLADNLVASTGVSSSDPYLFRKSPQNASAELHRLTGCTVSWNQLCNAASVTLPSGHKYFMMKSGTASVASSDGTAITGLTSGTDMVIDLTLMFGSTVADAIYTKETTTPGSGVAFFRSLFPSAYYPYSAPTLASVQTSARVARGFNQWDEEWEVGAYDMNGVKMTDSVRIRAKNPFPILPNTQYRSTVAGYYYEYGADGTFLSRAEHFSNTTFTTGSGSCFMTFHTYSSYGTTYKYDITIGFSVPEMLGVYVPYEAKTYLIDDVVLRGIPKLTNGVLSYDGDIYLPSGEVTRRYGVATFDGSETGWGSETVSGILSFYIHLATIGKMQDRVSGTLNNGQCRANNFLNVSTTQAWQFTVTSAYIIFRVDSTITTVAEWKTWLGNHPQTVLYPLATPTTETAEPYTEVQLAGTTEQFVTENYIPVGNESFYPTDLTGVVQNLAPLPTTAGTYKLQVTVSGGVPSYSWVAG